MFAFQKKGYDIESYGTGNFVKIPGKSAKEPNVYEFGTTYEAIHKARRAMAER